MKRVSNRWVGAERLEPRRLISGTVSTIATLNADDASIPRTLISDPAGNLFGVSFYGNGSSGGDVFAIDKATGTVRVPAVFENFTGSGSIPTLLALDASGNVYGSIDQSGTLTYFKIAAGTYAYSTLTSLDGITNVLGKLPTDQESNEYGITESGGAHGAGSIFEIPDGSQSPLDLASFDGSTARAPRSLFIDTYGNLYGIASGAANDVLFELPAGTNSILSLAQFGGTTGELASDKLGIDSRGNVFGTLQSGLWGASDRLASGGVFEVSAGNHAFNLLSSGDFNATRFGDVVSDSSGKVFGESGEGHFGSVFSINDLASAGPMYLVTPAVAWNRGSEDTTIDLQSLGASADGEGTLTYTWTLAHAPSGAALPDFSINGTNEAKHTTARFHKDGTYRFRCTIRDAEGRTVTTDVSVIVSQWVHDLGISALKSRVHRKKRVQILATLSDQFGHPMRTFPTVQFSLVTGGGHIDAGSGVYTAGTHTGLSRIQASVEEPSLQLLKSETVVIVD